MTHFDMTPLLTARETARHLEMPESTLDTWIRGQTDGLPLIHAVTPERRGWPRMPFVAIVEAYVLMSLRRLRMSMPEIRRAAELVRHELNDEYALANKRIVTDGVALFVQLSDQTVVQARDRQQGIREVLDDYLRSITWDAEGRPATLGLRQYPREARVVIDPRFGWGGPVLDVNKAPVDSVVDLWRAGEPMAVVAQEFDLSLEVVEDVLRAAA